MVRVLLLNCTAQMAGSESRPVSARLAGVHRLFRLAVLLLRAAVMRVFCPSVNILEQ